MNKEKALEILEDMYDYYIIKCYPQEERDAIKFAIDYIRKGGDENDCWV